MNRDLIKACRQFWPFLRPCLGIWILGMLLTIPVGALDAAIASFLKPFMDQVMVEQNGDFVSYVPFILIGFALLQGGFVYASAYVNGMVGNRLTLNIRYAVFHKLLRLSSTYYDHSNTGDTIFKCYEVPKNAATGMINNLKLFLTKFFSSISLCCVMAYQSWQLFLVAIGVAALILLPMGLAKRKLDEILKKTFADMAAAYRFYNEALAGSRVIKLFGIKGLIYSRFAATVTNLFRLSIKIITNTNWLSPLIRIITSVGIAIVLFYGVYLVVEQEITPGSFVAFIAALIMLYAPLKTLGDSFVQLQFSILMLNIIYEILDAPEEELNATASQKAPPVGRIDRVDLRGVSFAYEGGEQVLSNLSLTFERGKSYALAGASGSGKSTICALLLGLYSPQQGQILLDGTNIEALGRQALRERISVVFQDTFLFDGTIRDNLTLGNGASDEEIRNALRAVHLDEFVQSQPLGLDAPVGEKGALLSGGQRQRLGIARALLRDAPIVILDEATSALDNTSEQIIKQALRILTADRIVITVAHRASTLEGQDVIYTIDSGRLARAQTLDSTQGGA
ncbi:MAG: ABC transporter ATP-binding protein/permease [Succinivibrionaceae bacterium]|nr:ABC transporter ATP-binding protein/permease [Succinivibrionaceae bacterium]